MVADFVVGNIAVDSNRLLVGKIVVEKQQNRFEGKTAVVAVDIDNKTVAVS